MCSVTSNLGMARYQLDGQTTNFLKCENMNYANLYIKINIDLFLILQNCMNSRKDNRLTLKFEDVKVLII